MNYKSEIEKLLEQLKARGYTRSDIEKELDYSDNYMDQILSKGGNKKVVGSLQRLLQKAIDNERYPGNVMNDDGGDWAREKSEPLAMQALADLAASNRKMAEANRQLVATQAELIKMLSRKNDIG